MALMHRYVERVGLVRGVSLRIAGTPGFALHTVKAVAKLGVIPNKARFTITTVSISDGQQGHVRACI